MARALLGELLSLLLLPALLAGASRPPGVDCQGAACASSEKSNATSKIATFSDNVPPPLMQRGKAPLMATTPQPQEVGGAIAVALDEEGEMTAFQAGDDKAKAGIEATTAAPTTTKKKTTTAMSAKLKAKKKFNDFTAALNPDATNRSHHHCKQLAAEGDDEAKESCSCDVAHPVKKNYSYTCPSICPYSQNWTGEPCKKMCVWGDSCVDFHMARTFASNQVFECVPPCGKDLINQVPACLTCKKIGVCNKCFDGFHLVAGGTMCVGDGSPTVSIFYIIMGVFVIPLTIFLTLMGLTRPRIHSLTYHQGLQHRKHGYPCRVSPEHGGCFEPVSVYYNFCRMPTDPADQFSGVGTVLMFRYYCFLIFALTILTASLYSTYHFSQYHINEAEAADEMKNSTAAGGGGACGAPPPAGTSLLQATPHQAAMIASLISQGLPVPADLSAYSPQTIPWWSSLLSQSPTAGAGNPKEGPAANTNLAKKLKLQAEEKKKREEDDAKKPADDLRYHDFATMLGTYAILVLVSWAFGYTLLKRAQEFDDDHTTMKDFATVVHGLPEDCTDPKVLQDHLQGWLGDSAQIHGVSIAYEYCTEHEVEGEEPIAVEEVVDEAMDLWAEELDEKTPLTWLDGSEDVEKCPAVNLAGGLFACGPCLSIADAYWGEYNDDPHCQAEERKELEDKLKDVLPTMKCSGTAYVVFKTQAGASTALEEAAKIPRMGSDVLTMCEIYSEPEDISWVHHKREWNLLWKVPMSVIYCTLSGMFFFACLVPILQCTMHAAHIPGQEPDFMTANVLGLMPALGGVIVCIVADMCVEWCGYEQKHEREIYLFPAAFVLNYCTVVGDLVMVMAVAQGASAEEGASSAMGFDRVLARELYGTLVPAYIIFQSIVPAIAETVILAQVQKLLTRLFPMGRRAAEKNLEAFPFDFAAHYVDVLIGVAALFSLLCFLSPNEWRSIAASVLCVIAMYVTCQWCMIRGYQTSYCNSADLAWHGMHYWGFPLFLLLQAACFWGSFGGHVDSTVSCYAWAIHIVVYFGGLQIVKSFIPEGEAREDSYDDTVKFFASVGRHATFFNTNPVFCLRSKYLGESHAGPIVPWVPGKENFHPGSPTKCLPRPTWYQHLLPCIFAWPEPIESAAGGSKKDK